MYGSFGQWGTAYGIIGRDPVLATPPAPTYQTPGGAIVTPAAQTALFVAIAVAAGLFALGGALKATR